MKNRISQKNNLIALFAILIVTMSVVGQTNYSNIKLNSTKIQVTMQKDTCLQKRVSAIEEQKNNNDERIVLNLKQSTLLVEIMGVFLALFLGVVGYFNLYEYKKLKREIKEINSEADTKLKKVIEIEKKLKGNETYLHQGLENLYELLLVSANIYTDKEFYKMIFRKRAISQLYSHDGNERFIGITTLGEVGGLLDIEHLEYVLLNPDESNANKLLSNNAIALIKNRIPNVI